jgi:hypothetical protein
MPVRKTVVTAVFLAFVALSAVGSRAKELVEIRVRGYYYAAPATVSLVVAVEPGARNRALLVEADGEDYYRSSEIELDGDREKRLHTIEFRSLPAGDYVLRAQVRSKTELLGKAEAGLVVTGLTAER